MRRTWHSAGYENPLCLTARETQIGAIARVAQWLPLTNRLNKALE